MPRGLDAEGRRRTAGPVERATNASIRAATHLTPADAGAIAALKILARKIDTEDELRERALDYAREHQTKPPSVDNVSLPTYLKFSAELGLSPAGRGRLPERKGAGGGGKRGTLSLLQDRAKQARGGASAG